MTCHAAPSKVAAVWAFSVAIFFSDISLCKNNPGNDVSHAT
jgi:hypothetical protein